MIYSWPKAKKMRHFLYLNYKNLHCIETKRYSNTAFLLLTVAYFHISLDHEQEKDPGRHFMCQSHEWLLS